MVFYESFYVRKVNKEGKVLYFLRNLDMSQIESCEWFDNEHTKVFTKSGDKFVCKMKLEDLKDSLMGLYDEYGKLFIFYPN